MQLTFAIIQYCQQNAQNDVLPLLMYRIFKSCVNIYKHSLCYVFAHDIFWYLSGFVMVNNVNVMYCDCTALGLNRSVKNCIYLVQEKRASHRAFDSKTSKS